MLGTVQSVCSQDYLDPHKNTWRKIHPYPCLVMCQEYKYGTGGSVFLPEFHFMLLLCIHFQLLQTWLLKTTQIYYLTDLEVRSPSCVKIKVSAGLWDGSKEEYSPGFPSF